MDRIQREVIIHSLVVTDTDLSQGRFSMDITCSKGTYIRTLCHDIGIRLRNAAAMEKLVRTRVSVFRIEDAITLSELQQIAENQPERLEDYFMPVDMLFNGCKKAWIKPGFAKTLANGNKLSGSMFDSMEAEVQEGENILVYDENGMFKAIYKKEEKEYKVNKMF